MTFLKSLVTSEHLINLGISIGILLFVFLFRKIFTTYMYKLFTFLNKKADAEISVKVLSSFEKPVHWLFFVVGLYIAAEYFPYMSQDNVLFIHLIRSTIVFLIAWGLYDLSSVTSLVFENINEHSRIHIDEMLIPLLSKAFRFIIIVLTASIIALEFNYDVSGFVAGLGIGGLAVALAAKDMLANLIGGIVLISEKPFTLHEWIATPSVEGTVEDITFRSTKIRTFSQALVTVPNAKLADEPITNWSKMGKRRVSFTIRLAFDTPAQQIERVIDQARRYLQQHPDIHPETILVKLDEYKENGADLLFYFFTKTTNWEAYLTIKQQINFEIMRLLEDNHISIAIPNRRVYNHDEVNPPTEE